MRVSRGLVAVAILTLNAGVQSSTLAPSDAAAGLERSGSALTLKLASTVEPPMTTPAGLATPSLISRISPLASAQASGLGASAANSALSSDAPLSLDSRKEPATRTSGWALLAVAGLLLTILGRRVAR